MTAVLNLRGFERDPIYHVRSMERKNGKLVIYCEDNVLPMVFEFGKDFTYVETYWESNEFFNEKY